MIIEQINKLPFIHFGFNKQDATIELGQSITIWQDVLYSNNYQLSLNGTLKTSLNKLVITPSATGIITYQAEITEKISKRGISLESNTITLTVV